MSRRTLGRSPEHGRVAQLRAVNGAVISASVTLPAPSPTPVPSPADTLWAAFRADRSRTARDRLVVHYTPLVQAVAHRVAVSLPAYIEQSDLSQSGVFGLIEAVERFDPDRCPRFETYAAQRIRGAILDELRAQDWVPRTVRGRVRELERARERLEGSLLRAATERELAAEMGLPLREVRGLAQQALRPVSVEALDESSGGVADLFADNDTPDPMAVVQSRETMRHLHHAVGRLGERDRRVIHLYYVENRTLAEIGRLLGVTESRVCQLHTRLVGRLRCHLDEMSTG